MVTLYEFSYHCFLSYTTREEEVQEVQPRVDELIEGFTNYGYQVAPIFYDHYIFGSHTPSNLRAALSRAIHESAFMVILVPPGYFTSSWCIFEWSCMAETAPRRQDRIERYDTVRICRRVDAPFQFITIPPTMEGAEGPDPPSGATRARLPPGASTRDSRPLRRAVRRRSTAPPFPPCWRAGDLTPPDIPLSMAMERGMSGLAQHHTAFRTAGITAFTSLPFMGVENETRKIPATPPESARTH
jgi:hypothetical protein